ncbi:cadherin-related family member 5-like [Archocentrus centrarchus]|uniref:cadherin-related family member 5-like n=1 Tax=Archocentrus centrarchus TaxID=63155 RepID=UPI0011E9CF2C|nr:cadherin-related family member 5-like [Archocentrus centrarchus]
MDSIYPHFTVRTLFSLILLILLQTAAEATICSAPSQVEFPENNEINAVVVTINVEPDVTLEFNPPPANPDNPFELHESSMTATRVLDYETKTTYVAQITCKQTTTGLTVPITIIVLIINENDKPPVFDKNLYNAEVSEMAPIGATVGVFPATDLDKPSQLYYVLTLESIYFGLQSATNPVILVKARLDYEKVRNVQLVLEVQDTPLTLVNNRASFTATTTIQVTILDGDNRPPWFQPCTTLEVGGAVICQSSGYTGRVVLNEQEPGVLPLKPGPLYAIDGDSGINEEITYSFLSGNDDGLFEIGPNTGNITMLKPTDVLGTISLTVLATQKVNNHQFATTTVTISVQVKSLYPPKFQKSQYEGVISSVGTMAMDITNKDQPLRIIATDQDYSATEGLNPHITYSVKGSSDFSIINGYLFMIKDLPEGSLSLEVLAVDSTNDESDTALLSVEVKSGLTTSSLPLSTTDFITTTPISESTATSSISTTSPSESTISITNSGTLTPEESVSTPSKAPPVVSLSGEYGVADMAALGATLGALLLICLVITGVLAHRMQRGKADWRKIYEASIFRSSLGQGPGGQKEGIQYTNEAFQNDDDEGSVGSSGPERRRESTQKPVWDIPNKEAIGRSSAPLNALLPDDTSDVGSDKADSDKDVKPILTKERRMEEGYKSVWFKADIDPNAKEEVVIIPDREDSEEEDEEPSSSSRQNYQDGKPPKKTSKVLFTDTDLDSGLGVKIGELGDDSDTDEAMNIDL